MAEMNIVDLHSEGFKGIVHCVKCDVPFCVDIDSVETTCSQCVKEERHDVAVHIDKFGESHCQFIYNINEKNPKMAAIAYFSGFLFACRKMNYKLWDIMRWASRLAFMMPEMSKELEEKHESMFVNSIR